MRALNSKGNWKFVFGATLILLASAISVSVTLAQAQESDRSQTTITVADAPPPWVSQIKTHDDLLADVGRDVPEFGGMFLDPENEEILNIYLLDPAKKEAAEEALKKAFGAEIITPGGVRTVSGQYSMTQLSEWYGHVHALTTPGLVMTYLDEGNNRLVVGVENTRAQDTVKATLTELGVPHGAVNITIMEPLRLSATG